VNLNFWRVHLSTFHPLMKATIILYGVGKHTSTPYSGVKSLQGPGTVDHFYGMIESIKLPVVMYARTICRQAAVLSLQSVSVALFCFQHTTNLDSLREEESTFWYRYNNYSTTVDCSGFNESDSIRFYDAVGVILLLYH
jgi:hypothetical protein